MISHIAPANISGSYSVFVSLKTEAGFNFGTGLVGKVDLTSEFKGIEILPETCKLSILEDKNPYRRYTLNEGVDIAQSESLKLNCTAVNTLLDSVSAKPVFETHLRTAYGELVEDSKVENTPVTFNAGEKKDISILLPKAKKSQAYDVKVSLKYGNSVSNTITAHYVIQGVSVTIQNISLDKDIYKKGDNALLLLAWSPSADSFPGSRLGKGSSIPEIFSIISIKNNLGLNCSEPLSQSLIAVDNNYKNNIVLPINKNCKNPHILAKIVDKDGNVLDQRDFSVKSKDNIYKPSKSIILLIIGILILAIGIMLIFIKKNKNKKNDGGDNTPHSLDENMGNTDTKINIPVAMFIALFTIVSIGIYSPLSKTEAILLPLDMSEGGGVTVIKRTGTAPTGLNASITFDKSVYEPGAGKVINVTTSLSYDYCANATRDITVTGYLINDKTGDKTPTQTLFDTQLDGGGSMNRSATFAVPVLGGYYTLHVDITGNKLSSFEATDSSYPSFHAVEDSIGELTSSIIDHLVNNYSGYTNYDGEDINNVTNAINISGSTVANLESTLNYYEIPITISSAPGAFEFTHTYEIPDIRVRTVAVTVNGSHSTQTVSAGTDVKLWWQSDGTEECECKCFDATGTKEIKCGDLADNTGCGELLRTPELINIKLTETTTFKVDCK